MEIVEPKCYTKVLLRMNAMDHRKLNVKGKVENDLVSHVDSTDAGKI